MFKNTPLKKGQYNRGSQWTESWLSKCYESLDKNQPANQTAEYTLPRDPITLLEDDWGVQSPQQSI